MLPTLIAIAAVAAVIASWAISARRKLVALDENAGNALSQLGVQLSARFDALTALLTLTKGYAGFESEALLRAVQSARSTITAKSTPDDVLQQEKILSEALDRIAKITKRYPALAASQSYIQVLGAVHAFEGMMRTSRLIYNAGAEKLNREIRVFPALVIAGAMGLRQRGYLAAPPHKPDCAQTAFAPTADANVEIKE